MADCSAATAGYLEGVDSTRVQSRNCEAEDGEFGRSRGFVCSLPYFGFLCCVDLVDGPPQPVDTVANRRGISLIGAPNATLRSWIRRNGCDAQLFDAASQTSQFGTRDAPEVIRSRFWKSSQVSRLHLFDPESSLFDECGNITCHVAAFKGPLKERLRPFLPASHADIRRESIFKEQELASRPQDMANPSNGACHAGDRAQRERADDRIHAGLWQGDSLTR